MKPVIVLLLITTLCACAATSSTKDNLAIIKDAGKQWVGHSVDELIITYGDPTDVYTIAFGRRIFEYSNIKGEMLGSQAASAQKKKKEPRATMEGQRTRKKRTISATDPSQACVVAFNISASDIIESWSIESGECK